MNAIISRRPEPTRNFFRLAISVVGLFALLILSPPGAAADETNSATAAENYDIRIENGKFLFPSNAGPPYEATLGIVIEHLFRQRYPKASFVVSPKLTNLPVADLRLGNLQAALDPIAAELQAIRVASGDKFTVKTDFQSASDALVGALAGEPDARLYLLEPDPAALPENDAKKIVEAFNLSGLFRKSSAITEQMDEVRMQIELLRQQFGEQHPDVKEKVKKLEFLKREVDETRSEEWERMSKIQDVVSETLTNLGLPAKPDFNYHIPMSLLVVTGSREQIDVTRKVVNALLDKPSPPEPKPRPQP